MKPYTYWLEQKWSKLRLDPSQEFPEQFNQTLKKFRFLCDCGNTKDISFSSVLGGRTSSCGCRRREISKARKSVDLSGRVFGRLSVISLDHTKGKGRTFWKCKCSCGEEAIVAACHLLSGHTGSCGCLMKERIHQANFVDLSGKKFGMLEVQSVEKVGQGGKYRWNCICNCGNFHIAYGDSLVQGLTRSCGCARMGVSDFSPAGEIFKEVKILFPDAEFEVPLSRIGIPTRMSVDVWVPSIRLAVEYHGLVWHSEKYRKTLDYEKYKLCTENGIRLLQVYEDEWRDHRHVVTQFLRSLSKERSIRIRPLYSVEQRSPEIDAFLEKNHYLGSAGGCVIVVARHPLSVEIVGVWVFMKREEGTVLWHRAAWNHEYKAWNPHEKALRIAQPLLQGMGFRRILTFSDNRWHTGALYEKLGFQFETEIPPEYAYTRGSIRVSKFALRVKAGVNEREAAEAEGWYRVWDSGKKRFSLAL